MDSVLEANNRQATTADTIKAIRLLKGTGYKVVCHLMPDLPGSSPDLDRKMFERALTDPEIQFDDVKIYPTAVCKTASDDRVVTSDILTWYEKGLYQPYAEKNLETLIQILIDYKKRIQPWIRIQRLVRDIPSKSIESGYEKRSNLRQMIQKRVSCRCIRCKEIGEDTRGTPYLVVRQFKASRGDEFFITEERHTKGFWFWLSRLWFTICTMLLYPKKFYWRGNETTYDALYGFARLRLDPNPGLGFIPELEGAALLRELHVYGQVIDVGDTGRSQHRGVGSRLMKVAEDIAKSHGYIKMAVISGIGSREYYRNKCGYTLEGSYMVKYL